MKAVAAAIAFIFLAAVAFQLSTKNSSESRRVKVLSYSSFLASWGPAEELAKLFKQKTGIEVNYQDADDAGLLLSKLELFPSDVVLGLDRITAQDANRSIRWRPHGVQQEQRFQDAHFVAFDWAPLTFIYREGEIDPPKSLEDLLHPRFKRQVSLQDPRTSAPGLQFLMWLVALKGDDGAFDYLQKLRPNIRAVSPSWSAAYGLFQKGEAKVVFSYITSPIYHWLNEKDFKYKAAVLEEPLIYQTELAGIPERCENCDEAVAFLKFLISPEAQKLIMQRNVMLPVDKTVMSGTHFKTLPSVKLIDDSKVKASSQKKKLLINRWKDLKL